MTGRCVAFGTLAGGFVPDLWGSSSLSLASLLTAVLGGAAGLWLGVRLRA